LNTAPAVDDGVANVIVTEPLPEELLERVIPGVPTVVPADAYETVALVIAALAGPVASWRAVELESPYALIVKILPLHVEAIPERATELKLNAPAPAEFTNPAVGVTVIPSLSHAVV
jgi:hypothetical protein